MIIKLLPILTLISSITGLSLSLYTSITSIEGSELLNLTNSLSYFTIQSNVLVLISSLIYIFNIYDSKYIKLLKFGSLVNITVTCIVYFVLLHNLWNPQGIQYIYNLLLHLITPILFLLTWIFNTKYKLNIKYALYWLIYPLIYLIYSLIRGNLLKWYPYFFIDPHFVDTLTMIIYILALSLFIFLIGYMLVLLSKRISKPNWM